MNRKHLSIAALFGILCIGLVATFALPISARAAKSASEPTATPQTLATPTYAPKIDPRNFVKKIDNPYFPLQPGTIFLYEGKTSSGQEQVRVTVKSKTKMIMGVTCVEVRDIVLIDGQLEEATLDWYAQDREGNVWYFGEDTKEYKNGVVVSTAGTWLGGVDGAQPGIIMKAHPRVGDTYRQEYYAGEAEDMAQVLSLNESATVPYGSYTNVLMTNEWTPLSPGVAEHKYYAKGIGNILTRKVQGGTGNVKLVEIQHK